MSEIIARDLTEIPHLFVGKISDKKFQSIIHEIKDKIYEYFPIQINEDIAGPLTSEFEIWQARGIVDYCSDSKKICTYQRMLQIYEGKKEKIVAYKTDLYDKLINTVSVIENLTQQATVARLFLLNGNATLPWHSHNVARANYDGYKKIVIQIPLVNSCNCIYQSRHKESQKIDSKIYKPGEIWIFNSYHDHRVLNQSKENRLSLFIETDIKSVATNLDLSFLISQHKNEIKSQFTIE